MLGEVSVLPSTRLMCVLLISSFNVFLLRTSAPFFCLLQQTISKVLWDLEFGIVFFFFKQKTAYEMIWSLEFRRVLFRSGLETLVTNDAGEYSAPTLNPGKYKVRTEAKGFKTIERDNVVLEVGKEVRVDLSLAPGAVSDTITITESVPLVETTHATLGGTINNAEINDMPLNGRNYQNLMSLRPGVMIQPGGGPWTQSTNNVRPDETVWMVDGIINVN